MDKALYQKRSKIIFKNSKLAKTWVLNGNGCGNFFYVGPSNRFAIVNNGMVCQ